MWPSSCVTPVGASTNYTERCSLKSRINGMTKHTHILQSVPHLQVMVYCISKSRVAPERHHLEMALLRRRCRARSHPRSTKLYPAPRPQSVSPSLQSGSWRHSPGHPAFYPNDEEDERKTLENSMIPNSCFMKIDVTVSSEALHPLQYLPKTF